MRSRSWRAASRVHLSLGGLLAALLCCQCTTETAETDAPADVDAEPADACGAHVPLVTWETFGEGFVATYCQGCHASTTLDRQGAPEAVIFDTEDDALLFRSSILAAATGDEPTMPPNGGPVEGDRDLLDLWLTCFAD